MLACSSHFPVASDHKILSFHNPPVELNPAVLIISASRWTHSHPQPCLQKDAWPPSFVAECPYSRNVRETHHRRATFFEPQRARAICSPNSMPGYQLQPVGSAILGSRLGAQPLRRSHPYSVTYSRLSFSRRRFCVSTGWNYHSNLWCIEPDALAAVALLTCSRFALSALLP